MAKYKYKGIKYWKKKAWDEFSKFIRLRDALATTGDPLFLICCTCQKKYPAFGKDCAQAGHYLPGRKNSFLFDERGVHGQCYNCNINLKGNTILYRQFMIKKYNEKTVEAFEELFFRVKQYKPYELEELFEKYKQKVKEMEK